MSRETTKRFMSIMFAPFEQTAASLVEQLMSQFAHGFQGEPPPEVKQAVAVLENAINSRREVMETAVAEVVEKHLDEATLNVLIAHRETAEEKRLGEVAGAMQLDIMTLTNNWIIETGRSVEPQLLSLLGEAPEPAPLPEPPQAA